MSKFDLKTEIDNSIISVYNILADLKYKCSPSLGRMIGANSEYREKHKGERCFIFATGPSLESISSEYISKINSSVVFGVNSFYKVTSLNAITPTYYALLDNNYSGVSSFTFEEVYKKYHPRSPVFITDFRAIEAVDFLRSGVRVIPVHAKNYPLRNMRYDLAGNVSITMNVVSSCIQAAIYMGFDEIFLLGLDYTYFCNPVTLHCYDDSEERGLLPKYNLAFYLKYYHLTTEFHYRIAELARIKKVRIVNLFMGSLLDAYPKAELRSIV